MGNGLLTVSYIAAAILFILSFKNKTGKFATRKLKWHVSTHASSPLIRISNDKLFIASESSHDVFEEQIETFLLISKHSNEMWLKFMVKGITLQIVSVLALSLTKL